MDEHFGGDMRVVDRREERKENRKVYEIKGLELFFSVFDDSCMHDLNVNVHVHVRVNLL
jgi:hypothetical protein